MSIGDVNGLINIRVSGNFQTTAVGRRADKDGDNDANASPGSVRGRQGGGQLLSAVAQTLSQLGLGQAGQIAVTAPSATQNTSGNNNTDSAPSNRNIDPALHTFMHSLFQAMNQGSAQAANAPAATDSDEDGSRVKASSSPGTSSYTDLVSKLQSFVQNLGSSSSATSDLNTAFRNLQQAAGANGASGGNSPVSLQSFLQDLLKNLQSAGNPSLSVLANVVSTSA